MSEIKVYTLIQAIKDAFDQMSAERGWYQDLGLTKTGAGAIMSRYKKGTLSIEKMAELLEARGVTIYVEHKEPQTIN